LSFRHLLHVVGAVVAASGLAMFLPVLVGAIYGEWSEAIGVAASATLTVGVGAGLWRAFPRPGELTSREGFAAVGLSWILLVLFGAVPYVLTQSITDVSSAVFEAAAGFTTTGASVLGAEEFASFSHTMFFWRSLTQWMGGMGIIVLSIAILPLLGLGAVQLARAESPGPTPDRLTPRFRETAKRLWLVYFVLTFVEMLLLWAGDMTLFEAANHALTTMSTGGFSTNPGSLGAYSAYAQWVVIAFMVLAGASFALHYKWLKEPLVHFRSAEFRLYLGITLLAATAVTIAQWNGAFEESIRTGLFTAATIITTTGYGTADFALWEPALQVGIVGMMFIGGMAGSTSGSVKVYRLEVLSVASRMDVRRLIYPRGVFVTRVGKSPVPDAIVEAIQTFFLLYMFAFMTGTFLLSVVEWLSGGHLTLVDTVSAVASSLGNVGPGLGEVGPAGNYAGVSAMGKWVLSALMIVGRLEILPIIILFNRDLWRR
jgi:trk system potassium uptake protein TrkH